MHDRSQSDFHAFLASRSGYYDAIWVSRTTNLDRIRPVLDDSALVPDRTRIILDTAGLCSDAGDVTHLGAARKGAAVGRAETRIQRHCCHEVLAVNEQEAGLLTDIGLNSGVYVGTMRDVAPTLRPWQERSGLLFLGDLRRAKSPDLDALDWFVDEVLPLIE